MNKKQIIREIESLQVFVTRIDTDKSDAYDKIEKLLKKIKDAKWSNRE